MAQETRDGLLAGADALEAMARWSEQPDEPTGCHSVLSAHDLYLRAAAMRSEADVLPKKRRRQKVTCYGCVLCCRSTPPEYRGEYHREHCRQEDA